jgi:putative sigma-54 modulation protein
MTLRGEETDGTVQAAIDKVADKLENRLRRLKSRIIKSHRHKGRPVPNGLEENHAEPADHEPAIVEFKRFRLKPMTVEDAGLQLEMLGHPFFVFLNSESGQTEVIYKREDGDFGLIAPDL